MILVQKMNVTNNNDNIQNKLYNNMVLIVGLERRKEEDEAIRSGIISYYLYIVDVQKGPSLCHFR